MGNSTCFPSDSTTTPSPSNPMNPPTLIRQATRPAAPQQTAPPSPVVETGGLDEVKTAAKDQLVQTGADLKHGAQDALHAAKEAGADFVSDQKSKLAAKIDEFTHAVKAASVSLKEDASNPLAGPAEKASQHLERAANYLRDNRAADFLDDLGSLARRRPEVFFGGLFILGLAAARFLKASAPAANGVRRGVPLSAYRDDSELPRLVIAPELRETRTEDYSS